MIAFATFFLGLVAGVQDGLAYLSYWNDGLVVLDVGNGVKGGSPSNPQLVTQYKYDLNKLYSEVEAVAKAGYRAATCAALPPCARPHP